MLIYLIVHELLMQGLMTALWSVFMDICIPLYVFILVGFEIAFSER